MAPIFSVFRLLPVAIAIGATAADRVDTRAPSEPYLFAYEKSVLTDDAVSKLSDQEQKLFGFDDSAVGSGIFRRSGECKRFPGDQDWPSDETWNRFNELVDGALIPTVPLAAPCYNNWGVYDAAKCADIAKRFTDPYLQ